MTCTDKQIGKLMKLKNRYTQEKSALKVGIDRKTARKYIAANRLPSEFKKERDWRTRPDPFKEAWPTIAAMLESQPGLEAKTLLEWLIERDLNNNLPVFHEGQLRTLQRRIRDWRAVEGPDKAVIFPQHIQPGKQSQSDCTWMNDLNITLAGEAFNHLLFHFMLPYSRWEYVSICFSESFESLSEGYTEAVWYLGGVLPEHRTDNLTAATHAFGGSREFNETWTQFLAHHHVKPSRNNPGQSHENGSVEKSHDLFKKAVDQQLMLRGSRDFDSRHDYEVFLKEIQRRRNAGRHLRFQEEALLLKTLPERHWYAPESVSVHVSSASTIVIKKGIYSVPSRLIGYTVTADIFAKEIQVRYGKCLIQAMPRLAKDAGFSINYRHIIAHLIRKPGAFLNYQYHAALFPRVIFKKSYDVLIAENSSYGIKQYLHILNLAAVGAEQDVALALEVLLEEQQIPDAEKVKSLLDLPLKELPIVNIINPDLAAYDGLLSYVIGDQ